jgi:ribosomal protein S27AE
MLRRDSHIIVKTARLVPTKAYGGDAMSFLPQSPSIYFLGFQTCPNCKETVFAAEGADVADDAIRYRWTCDFCGHAFITEAHLIYEVAA